MITPNENAKYLAKVYRFKKLKESAERDVEVMLRAFLPEGGSLEFEYRKTEKPGFPHAPKDKVVAYLRSANDSHIFAQAETKEACMAQLLAAIFEGHGWMPMT